MTATIELFRVGGYNGTSLKDVTRAADAPIGSLYHHFKGGKDELAEVALRDAGATYKQLLEAVWDDAGDPVAAIRAFFDSAADVLESTDFIDPCPVGTVARETASTNEPLRLATAAVSLSWTDEIFRRLKQTTAADPQVLASIAHTATSTFSPAWEPLLLSSSPT